MTRVHRPHRLVGIAVVTALLLTACGDDDDDGDQSSSTSSSTTTEQTTTTEPTSSTTSAPTLPAPESVVARAGGGSGEVELEWSAVPGATGYQVQRAGTAAGPFEPVATIDVETGEATASAGVVNVWSDAHAYIPGDGALSEPDASDTFRLVDVGSGSRCFQVRALQGGEPGTPSAPACASPP